MGPSRRTTKVGAGRCKIVAFLCSQATSGLLLSYNPYRCPSISYNKYIVMAMPMRCHYTIGLGLGLGERSQIPTKAAATSKQHVWQASGQKGQSGRVTRQDGFTTPALCCPQERRSSMVLGLGRPHLLERGRAISDEERTFIMWGDLWDGSFYVVLSLWYVLVQ